MKNKGLALFWTDVLNLIAFGGLLMTGVIIKWVLPHGGEGGGRGMGRSRAVDAWFGLSRHEWGDIHFWIAVACVGLVILHLALHTNWIVNATSKYLFGWSAKRERLVPVTPSARTQADP